MSTPNPLLPQGSIPQPGTKAKSNVRLVVFFVVAVHAVFIVGLLVQGCKPEPKPTPVTKQETPTPTPSPEPSLGPLGNEPAVTTGAAPSFATGPAPASAPTHTATGPVASLPPTGLAPAPTPTPEPPPAGGTREYVINKGDNFSTIAKKLHVSLKAIQDANPGVDSSKLKIGQKIQVPEGSSAPVAASTTASVAGSTDAGGTEMHVVKSGETLSAIARKHATTVQAIRSANNLKTDRINAGQKLKVPSARAAAAAPAEPVATTPAPTTGPAVPITPLPPAPSAPRP